MLLGGSISPDEARQNPQDVVDVLNFQMNFNRGRVHESVKSEELPSEKELINYMEKITTFREEDPSKNYDILKKIGVGGFGKVFLCKKQSTGEQCALKYVDPKTEKDIKIIRNEIGMM